MNLVVRNLSQEEKSKRQIHVEAEQHNTGTCRTPRGGPHGSLQSGKDSCHFRFGISPHLLPERHGCHIRVIDTFGTEPAYNHEEYATLHGYRTNWGYWNLHGQQYMTMFPHTPDNSFMGFVAEELNETERLNIQRNKVNNMAVVYGKEASMWK
ncbi:alpha-1,6-mannosylglycoprotein 6-beta-N-acetylglucosaminyltransferase B-like protein, partial [Lates japonicus]